MIKAGATDWREKRVSFPVLQRVRQYQGISREAGYRGKNGETGIGQTEQVGEVNARIFLS